MSNLFVGIDADNAVARWMSAFGGKAHKVQAGHFVRL